MLSLRDRVLRAIRSGWRFFWHAQERSDVRARPLSVDLGFLGIIKFDLSTLGDVYILRKRQRRKSAHTCRAVLGGEPWGADGVCPAFAGRAWSGHAEVVLIADRMPAPP